MVFPLLVIPLLLHALRSPGYQGRFRPSRTLLTTMRFPSPPSPSFGRGSTTTSVYPKERQWWGSSIQRGPTGGYHRRKHVAGSRHPTRKGWKRRRKWRGHGRGCRGHGRGSGRREHRIYLWPPSPMGSIARTPSTIRIPISTSSPLVTMKPFGRSAGCIGKKHRRSGGGGGGVRRGRRRLKKGR